MMTRTGCAAIGLLALFSVLGIIDVMFFMGGRNSVVECQLPKLDAVGSSPIARSMIIAPPA